MAQILIILGATIFGLLGVMHLLTTLLINEFEARDASVTEAMKATSPVITKETTVWNAWTGFNASPSLGAMLVAAVYVPLAMFDVELIQQSLWFSVPPTIIGFSYLFLAAKYRFKIPLIGLSISTACFAAAATLINT